MSRKLRRRPPSFSILAVGVIATTVLASPSLQAAPRSSACSAAFAAFESEVVTAARLVKGGALGQHQATVESFSETIRLLKKAKFDTYLIEGASRKYESLLPGFRKVYGSPGSGPLLQMDLVKLKFALQRGEIRLPAAELAELQKHHDSIEKALDELWSIDALSENVFALKADGLYRALKLVKEGRDVLSSRELKAARDSFDEAAKRTNGTTAPAPYIPPGSKPKPGANIIRADERRGDLFEAWAIVSRKAGDQTPKTVEEVKDLLKSKPDAVADFLERESKAVELADLKLAAAKRKKVEKASADALADEERLWWDTILEGEVKLTGKAKIERIEAWVWKDEPVAYLVEITAPASENGVKGSITSKVLLGPDLKKIEVQKWIAEFND